MRMIRVLLLALLVGLAIGLFKGNGSDAVGVERGAIGNLSAPWLLVPALAAWRARSAARGALVGLVATVVALLGFYVGMLVYVHGHLGLSPGPLHEFWYVVRANRIWFAAGVVSGPVMGAAAAALGRRLPASWLWVLAGVVLALELPVVGLVAGVHLPVLGFAWGVADWTVYGAEAVLGVAVLLVGAARLRRPGAASGV